MIVLIHYKGTLFSVGLDVNGFTTLTKYIFIAASSCVYSTVAGFGIVYRGSFFPDYYA